LFALPPLKSVERGLREPGSPPGRYGSAGLAVRPAFQRATRFGRRFQPAAPHEPDPDARQRQRLCRTMARTGLSIRRCRAASSFRIPVATPLETDFQSQSRGQLVRRVICLFEALQFLLVFCATDLPLAKTRRHFRSRIPSFQWVAAPFLSELPAAWLKTPYQGNCIV
jgi:hypothetical protein